MGQLNPFYIIPILGRLNLSMKVLIWYIDPNGHENTYIVKYPYLTGVIKSVRYLKKR